MTSEIALGPELTCAAQTQSAGETLPEILACAIREFRQPLREMLDSAEQFRTIPVGPELKTLPARMVENGEYLLHRIDSLTDLVQLNAGAASILQEVFDLELTVTDVFESLAQEASVRSLDFFLNFSPGLPRRAVGDPDRIRRLIRDLCESWIRDTPSGPIYFDLDIKDATPTEFRLRGVLCGAAGASGDTAQLQAAVAKNLVTLMNGRIRRATQGSRRSLVFEIPFRRDPKIWHEPPLPGEIGKLTALLVGFAGAGGRALQKQLSALGIKTEEAQSCEAAMLSIGSGAVSPGVLFVDTTRNPWWDDFGRWVQSIGEGAAPPCVAVCGTEEAPSQAHLDSGGYSALFRGAFTPGKIRKMILRLSGHQGAATWQGGDGRARSNFSSPRVLAVLWCEAGKSRIAETLDRCGCAASFIVGAGEPLEAAREAFYDLAIVDLARPDAAEVARVLAEYWPGGRTTILGLLPEHSSQPCSGAQSPPSIQFLAASIREAELGGHIGAWTGSVGGRAAYNHAEALERCGGDGQMLADLGMQFCRGLGGLLAGIRKATGHQDQRESLFLLRQLFAQAEFFSARKLAVSVKKLEALIMDGNWSGTHQAIGAIRVLTVRLVEQISAMVETR